ncbi:DegV family EDD domain-containing protein [bacterium]|nr:DegV family EDD domain-containing protein [bacterium]
MKKVAYLYDSSSGIINDDVDNDIFVVPNNIIYVVNNEIKSFAENVNISQQEIDDLLLQKKDLKTALVNPEVIKNKVLELLKQYQLVIYVPISYAISSTYDKAMIVMKEINEQFHETRFIVIKSNAVSYFATIVMDQVKKLYNGSNLEEVQKTIDDQINKNYYCGILFVNNLDTLIKGGRIKKAKAALANLLNFKLLILMSSSLQFFAKAISYNTQIEKALKFFNEVSIRNNLPIEEVIFVKGGVKSTNDEYETKLDIKNLVMKNLNLVKNPVFKEAVLPGVIKCHTGINCYAIVIKLAFDQ